jgi:hypothetical protein
MIAYGGTLSPFTNLAHEGIGGDVARHPRTGAYVKAILARSSFAPMVAAEKSLFAG